MSHFTVLVIGPNVEGQLNPFNENMEVDEYDRGPVGEDELERFAKYYADGRDVHALYAEHGVDWNGGRWRVAEDGKFHDYSTYNPNSKWDWYKLGGRWTGFFKLKKSKRGVTGRPGLMTEPAPKGWADQARKGDIDFEGMRAEKEKNFREHYRAVADLFGGTIPKIESWESVRKRFGDERIEEAREAYHAQEAVKIYNKSNLHGFSDSLSDYPETEDEYAAQGRASAISTFAVVKDGKWYERGEMGWWGIVSDEKERAAWDKEFSDLLDSLPDDTLLSVVDCHI